MKVFPLWDATIHVRRLPLLARLFGERVETRDGDWTVRAIWWRGICYVVSEKHESGTELP